MNAAISTMRDNIKTKAFMQRMEYKDSPGYGSIIHAYVNREINSIRFLVEDIARYGIVR